MAARKKTRETDTIDSSVLILQSHEAVTMITSSQREMQSIVMSMFVCLFVSSLAYVRNHTTEPNFCACFFVHVRSSSNSVVIRYTSGFVDDVMFSHSWLCVALRGESVVAETTTSVPTEFRLAIKISKHTS